MGKIPSTIWWCRYGQDIINHLVVPLWARYHQPFGGAVMGKILSTIWWCRYGQDTINHLVVPLWARYHQPFGGAVMSKISSIIWWCLYIGTTVWFEAALLSECLVKTLAYSDYKSTNYDKRLGSR